MAGSNRTFDGKVAIVTGAARGIGFVIAHQFAAAGATVALVDLDVDEAQRAAATLTSQGLGALGLAADVSRRAPVQQMVQAVMAVSGRIDILVNNAGICPLTPAQDIDEAEWDRVLAVNLKGTFLCCQAVMPIMLNQRAGRIINIASSAGQMGGLAVGVHYSAAKAGILGLTKSFARILAPEIQVNAVSPGTTATDMTSDWGDDMLAAITRQIPLRRLGQPGDIAAAVLFLAADESGYITGQTLSVNGGLLMV